MKKIFCLFFILAAGFIFTSDSHPAENTYIRVAVIRGKAKITLAVKGPYRLEAIRTDLLLDRGERLRKEYIIPTDAGLKIGNKNFKIYGVRVIPKRDSSIYINGKRYRGLVDIIRTKDLGLLAVNHIELESYLYGVLFHEVPHYWPYETLKAQAVAARTFALYRIEACGDRDYDVTSDVYSQVYGGRGSERWKTTGAVKAFIAIAAGVKFHAVFATVTGICAAAFTVLTTSCPAFSGPFVTRLYAACGTIQKVFQASLKIPE